jgi:CheY-like chemotaxis protein
MAKIMLVEDDNNLREIYGERLMAEGYEIVSASDGEEALAVAVKEKPDLIIADVMMPKISGFDMLDILRQAPETKNTKVIMMTALGQAEDKDRAEKLGADKYLVKSQVTLEDVARVVHDLLGDSPAPDAAEPGEDNAAEEPTAPAATEATLSPSATLTPEPPVASSEPTGPSAPAVPDAATTSAPAVPPANDSFSVPVNVVSAGQPASPSSTPNAESTAQETNEVADQIKKFVASPPAEEPQHVAPLIEPSPVNEPATTSPPPRSTEKVIQPSPDQPKDINQLYAEEMSKGAPGATNAPASNPGQMVSPSQNNQPPADPNQVAL